MIYRKASKHSTKCWGINTLDGELFELSKIELKWLGRLFENYFEYDKQTASKSPLSDEFKRTSRLWKGGIEFVMSTLSESSRSLVYQRCWLHNTPISWKDVAKINGISQSKIEVFRYYVLELLAMSIGYL